MWQAYLLCANNVKCIDASAPGHIVASGEFLCGIWGAY